MHRRDVPKALLASAAGAMALTLPREGAAQTCNAPCFQRTQGEIAASVVPVDYAYPVGNIRRYGAVCNGTTDDSAAVRKALDVAAKDGTTVTCVPAGLIKINSTVYIPQRIGNESEKGFLMDFYGSTFRGQGRGSGTIFETGTGAFSTGSATNFGQPDESSTALHYGTIVAGARFRECGTALHLFNFVKGCKLQDLWFEDVDHCVTTLRSFYLELHNCHAQIQTITAGHTLFDFSGVTDDRRN